MYSFIPNKIQVIISILCLTFLFSGCSLLKIASNPFKFTVNKTPQKINKSEKDYYHKSPEGEVTKYREKIYNQEDRKITLKEKILQFMGNLQGYLFWVFILSVVLTFTGFGWIVSAFWQSVFGLGKVLRSTIRGITKAKRNGGNYLEELRKEHDKDKYVKKVVNSIRAEEI